MEYPTVEQYPYISLGLYLSIQIPDTISFHNVEHPATCEKEADPSYKE